MKKKIVVIGGGLGGLSAAISLATNPDYDITVVEKNAHLGGKLNVETINGYTFDLGPSIYTMPHIFDELFRMHGKKREDYYTIQAVAPHWRNFFEDGTTIDLEPLIDDMTNNDVISDEDLHDLKRFYDYTATLYAFTDAVLFKNQSEKKLDTLKHYKPFKIIKDSDMFKTMDEGVRAHVKNPYLRDILNFFIKYVGSSPFDAPAVMSLLPYIQWRFGLWYVDGGMFNLSKGLVKLAKELGINTLTNKEVVSVERVHKTITHVRLNDNTQLECDILISNMEAIPFYEKITKEDAKKLKKDKKKYAPSCSGFALHLGVNKRYDQLAHHNVFYSKVQREHFDKIFHEHTLTSDPTIYLVAPMKTDPSQGPKDKEIIKILPHIPVVEKDKPFTESEYDMFKSHIYDKLERMGLKDLRQHVEVEEIWTPERIEATYYSNQGSIYGVVADKKKNMGFKFPKQSKRYSNLFFAGGSTNPGGGMPMVVLSGQQVAKQVEHYLTKPIK